MLLPGFGEPHGGPGIKGARTSPTGIVLMTRVVGLVIPMQIAAVPVTLSLVGAHNMRDFVVVAPGGAIGDDLLHVPVAQVGIGFQHQRYDTAGDRGRA